MPRRFIRRESWEFGGSPPSPGETSEPKSRKRRLATTFVFTTLFFAGASLAAFAGDRLSPYTASDAASEAATTDTTTTTDANAPAPAAAPASDAAATAAATAAPATDAAAPADASTDATAQNDAIKASGARAKASASAGIASGAPGADSATTSPNRKSAQHRKTERLRSILLPKIKPAAPPEIEGPADAATIWLNALLPDPTPPALRLSPKFAANLRSAAKGAGVDWAVMLAILRARGAAGHTPADSGTLNKLADRLGSYGPTKGAWATVIAYSGDSTLADKAAALARYDRAVGLMALVKGLEAAKQDIATRLLSDPMVSIYEDGRNDIIANKVDVRVLAMIAYLRETFGQVTVSSLISGHRLYARPGVISAHVPGHAVDIAGLDGTPIQGHQEPGGITERAVRAMLLAPAEIMPRQIISLLGMGGPSFPLADHYNHIHIGY
jgi:hypothetical protein